MKKQLLGTILSLAMVNVASRASAALTLIDTQDWKMTMGGFVETDLSNDSTRSLGEIIGNSPVARRGTFTGDNGRTQFSDRNSRLNFTVLAPEQEGWKSKGVFELDFFGYDPTPSTSQPKNSEASFYQNPVPRIRHAYMSVEKDGWQFLTGQTWTLFGWQPYYFPTILTISPAPGELFQRNLQVLAMKSLSLGESSHVQAAISAERPSQRDSAMPNVNVGVRYVLDGWRSGYAATSGDIKTEPLSVGVSGSFRQFAIPMSPANTAAESHFNSSAVAVDALIPLIPRAEEQDPGNSLTLNAEFTSGRGYADSLPGWTGGLQGFPQGAGTVSADTHLDAGFGGFDAAGHFKLIQLQTWNLSLQYMLPAAWKSFVTAGYASIDSNNVGDLVVSAAGASDVYDKSSMYFINYLHDFTRRIRVGVEYDKTQTHYFSDGANPYDNRFQATALYRF
jgi:hypothetical protein